MPRMVFDQIFVADRFAEAEDLSGRLRVEQRFGNETGLMVNDFDVLAAGVEDFDHFRVVQHGKKASSSIPGASGSMMAAVSGAAT